MISLLVIPVHTQVTGGSEMMDVAMWKRLGMEVPSGLSMVKCFFLYFPNWV